MVDLRLTRPLPPTGENGVRPPAVGTTTTAVLSPSTSPSKTGINRMKIEQSDVVQVTPEQIRQKRSGKYDIHN